MSANLASVSQPGSVMSAEFTYESLEYAAKEIRLVEIIRRTDQFFEVRLSKYEISDAPEYNAISYTWGDGVTTRMTDIIVNGQKMQVTENCRYALEQAHYQYHLPQPSRVHFWIDSICINQNSHMEKQHQVAMMGRIYAQAVRVLACVGRHRDNSEDLADLVQKVKNFCLNVAEQPTSLARTGQGWFDRDDWPTRVSLEIIILNAILARTAATIIRFPKTFFDFSQRYYWTRLWIIQEVAVAKHLEILCGSDIFSRSDIYLLHWIAAYSSHRLYRRKSEDSENEFLALRGLYDTQSFSNFKFVLERNSMDRIPALEILSFQSPFGCSRPEDRVYGMLSLMKWPEVDPPILVEPIYKPSVNFDLAELFLSLPNCSLKNIQGIFKALEIYHHLDKIEELVAARSIPPTEHSGRSSHPVCHYDLGFCACEIISKNKMNQLTAYLSRRKEPVNHSPRILNMIQNAPQLLYAGSEVAALLCEAASEGDFLIQTPFGQCLLVLRYRSDSNHYQIVGQGLLIHDFFLHKFEDCSHPNYLKPRASYARQWFRGYLRHQAWLLHSGSRSFQSYLHVGGLYIQETYIVDGRPRSDIRNGLSERGRSRLDLGFALLDCTREFKDIGYPRAEFQPRVSDVLMRFTLALEPLEMLLLGCQDLEKDGSRNEGKAMQRLNTTVYGRVLGRETLDSLGLSDYQDLGYDLQYGVQYDVPWLRVFEAIDDFCSSEF